MSNLPTPLSKITLSELIDNTNENLILSIQPAGEFADSAKLYEMTAVQIIEHLKEVCDYDTYIEETEDGSLNDFLDMVECSDGNDFYEVIVKINYSNNI